MSDFVVVSSDSIHVSSETLVKRGAESSTDHHDHHLIVCWICWQRRKSETLTRLKPIVSVCWECLVKPEVNALTLTLTPWGPKR